MDKEEKAVAIEVPREDPKEDDKKERVTKDMPMPASKPVSETELSEEDEALKEGLELAVTRIQEGPAELYLPALEHLSKEIKSSTSSMTSVPKPLKFLRPHYAKLEAVLHRLDAEQTTRPELAPIMATFFDVMSVLAMTMAPTGSRDSLKYRLRGSRGDVASWGHEYVRSLAGDIGAEYTARSNAAADAAELEGDLVEPEVDDLLALVGDIVPYNMTHNAEAEAVDLLMEVQQLSRLLAPGLVDERNFERVCLYLVRCADYVDDPEDRQTLFNVAFELYRSHRSFPDALRVALRCDDASDRVLGLLSPDSGASALERKQLALILARQRTHLVVPAEQEDADELNALIGNDKLSELYRHCMRKLDLDTPKAPEDIYKTQAGDSSSRVRRGDNGAPTDSARANLASTYVSAFANAGLGSDKLLAEDSAAWVYKNKEHGMLAAVASLGMLHLWDVDACLNEVDKFFRVVAGDDERYVQAGACLAVGVVCAGRRHESDPALALLAEHVSTGATHHIRCAASIALGIAYAGSQREDVAELLSPLVSGETANVAEAAFAAVALGLVHVGSCNGEAGSTILQCIMERTAADLDQSVARFLCLGLGLLFLGRGDRSEAMEEAVTTVIEHPIAKYAQIVLQSCAFAGTGDVLKVQQMLHTCAERLTEKADHQGAAVLGIALIALGEDVGTEMCHRAFEHLLHYGEAPVRRAVPLAMSLLSASHADYAIVDKLSRLSHDTDSTVAASAVLGLGLLAGGTNNSRVAGLLRQLSDFYSKDADMLLIVRLAQGLNAMGKGTLSMGPVHSDRFLTSAPAVAALLIVMHGGLDMKHSLLDKYHYILYVLSCGINPRFAMTVDEELAPVEVTVRVGQAVETVGQAGRPKTITGFQTLPTPVLVGARDRVEIAQAEFTAITSVVESVVIVRRKEEAGAGAGAGMSD